MSKVYAAMGFMVIFSQSVCVGYEMNVRDEVLFDLIAQEEQRQNEGVNLVASENYPSAQVLDVVGSVLANKYTEGYPGRRYYGGCQYYDAMEQLTIDRFKTLFCADACNVQPHSGSQANAAVYLALLQAGDTILSMSLAHGGHLSHGHKMNWTSSIYNIVSYGVDPVTYQIDYDEVERLALECKPKMIIAGASAYPFVIDFARFAAIAQKVGALFLADIAHIAGLVAAGVHPSPVPYADVVTLTTQKTFRGPRGGVILCKKAYEAAINKSIIPGMQGGALMNNVIAKGVAAYEAMQPEFTAYAQAVVENSAAMAQWFVDHGYRVMGGGTQNHLFVIDVTPTGMNGKEVEQILESIGIYLNRNAIPYDQNPPLKPSGIRIGTAAMTTRGMTKAQFIRLAQIIDAAIVSKNDVDVLATLKKEIKDMTAMLVPVK